MKTDLFKKIPGYKQVHEGSHRVAGTRRITNNLRRTDDEKRDKHGLNTVVRRRLLTGGDN